MGREAPDAVLFASFFPSWLSMQAPYPPPPPAPQPYAPHPYAPPPPPPSGWPPAARWAVGCGSCCGVLVLLELVLIWGSLQIGMGMRPPEGLKARVTVPRAPVAGERFPLVLEVRNEGSSAFTVTNITARSGTLRQFQLSNPQPKPAKTTSVWGSTIWSFQQSVPPGGKWTLRLDARVAEPGEASGALEIQSGLAGMRPARFTVQVKPEK